MPADAVRAGGPEEPGLSLPADSVDPGGRICGPFLRMWDGAGTGDRVEGLAPAEDCGIGRGRKGTTARRVSPYTELPALSGSVVLSKTRKRRPSPSHSK